jgi:hypothetical protein
MNLFLIIVAAIIIGNVVYAVLEKPFASTVPSIWIRTKRTKINARDIENAKRRSAKLKWLWWPIKLLKTTVRFYLRKRALSS